MTDLGLFLLLVIIGVVYAFHEYLAVIDTVSQSLFQQGFDTDGVSRAAVHGVKILLLVNLAPVNTHLHLFLENQVKPDACRTAISFHKRVRHIHLHILVRYLVERRLRHLFNHLKVLHQVFRTAEDGATFRDGLGAYLAGKVVEATEEVGVNLL